MYNDQYLLIFIYNVFATAILILFFIKDISHLGGELKM